MQEKSKLNWNLHLEVTVDELMVCYKGKYCPVHQYIPKKPTTWGIKIWSLASTQKQYVYDFNMYTSSMKCIVHTTNKERGAKIGYEVVMLLMHGLHGRGHVLVTNCYFTSMKLTINLATLETYAIGIVMSNHVGLPKSLAQR